MAILEEGLANRKLLTAAELLSEVQAMGLKTPDESVIFIRKERDARSRR
jgi:hypothetical protein